MKLVYVIASCLMFMFYSSCQAVEDIPQKARENFEYLATKQSYKEAYDFIKPYADQGFPYAQVSVGWMHQGGLYVKQSFDEALKWYTRAFEQGSVIASERLGMIYGFGMGVPQNLEAGHTYLLKAAVSGRSAAQQLLSTFYTQNGKYSNLIGNYSVYFQ